MNKKLTVEDKLSFLKDMYDGLSVEQVKHLEDIANIDARYKCAQRYKRALNQGKYGERKKAMEYYRRYRHILEGLDCVENKLWTDEKKIRAFSDMLDKICDKCVALVDENNRRHLQRLVEQRNKHQKEYLARKEKYDKEIAELQDKLR